MGKVTRSWMLLTIGAVSCWAQTVWFCPTIPASWNHMAGSVDYLNLFAPGSAWGVASSHVQIFKMYTQMIDSSTSGSFSDAELQEIFAYLNSNHIALALEFGPLTPDSTGCGMGIEGFGGQAALPVATRIKQLGGNLQYIAMDEPFSYGSLYSAANACHWTAQQIAANAVQNLAPIKNVFPEVVIGDIDVVPNSEESPDWLDEYMTWIDTWQAVAGTPFAFFHFDVNWSVNWKPGVEALRQALAARGIPFGMIYNGSLADQSNSDWINDSKSHYAEWEAQGGARPDQIVFQSWYAYPQHVLPESDPTAFTSLIDSYFRQRTVLSLIAGPSGASGKLSNATPGGVAVSSAPVAITVQPIAGPGFISSYNLTGTVPQSITQAVIQICVNECGETSASDLNVYGFEYGDAGGQVDPGFNEGLNGWIIDGNGTALVKAVSGANGNSAQISATSAQQTFINSAPFTVSPGSPFNLAVRARVSPASAGSGYFALVFLANGIEVSRSTLAFAPATLMLGTPETDGAGNYAIATLIDDAGAVQVQAAFAGSDALWPAFAVGTAAAPIREFPCTACGRRPDH